MSGLSEVNSHGNFSMEKYQTIYTKKTLAIQAALGIIAISGITLAVLSHYGCIDRVFLYIGTGGAVTSTLTALGIFVFGGKNNFRDALADVHSVADLRQVCQNLEFHELCCCHPVVLVGEGRYINVTSSHISGTVSHYELEDKIKRLKSTSSNSEDGIYLESIQNVIDDHFYGPKV